MLLLHQYQIRQGGLLRKLLFLLLLSLLVCGEKEQASLTVNDVVRFHRQPPNMHEKQLKRSLRHSPIDALFSSKRKVPNAADPLHNR